MTTKEANLSKHTLSLAREDEAFQEIRNEYLNSSSENIEFFYRRYENAHSAKNKKSNAGRFGRTTFRTLLRVTIDPIELVRKKKGHSEAEKVAREIRSKFCHRGAYFHAQNDVLHAPIAIAHPKTRKYIGIPKHYVSMNTTFRGIRGHLVDCSRRGENGSLMIELAKRAILPKTKFDEMYGLSTQNPFWGLCVEEIYDGGPGANNAKLMKFAAFFGIGIKINRSGKPWDNAFIERFHDTFVRRYISNLPGYMPGHRNSHGSEASLHNLAVLDKFQYEVIAERYHEDYRNTKHSGLFDQTPVESYLKYLSAPDSVLMAKPIMPNNPGLLRDYCVPLPKPSRIQAHKGIQIDNRFYGSSSTTKRIAEYLKARKRPAEVTAHIDYGDFSYIKINDPETGELVSVPFTRYGNPINDDNMFDDGISTLRVEMINKYREMSNEEIVDEAKRLKRNEKRNHASRIKRSTPEPIEHGRLSIADAEFAAKTPLSASLLPVDIITDAKEQKISSVPSATADEFEQLDSIFGVE